jgi:hypothetical protein
MPGLRWLKIGLGTALDFVSRVSTIVVTLHTHVSEG